MTHQIVVKNVAICSLYGILSILQTLNSRTMYKDLHFDYYSFTFAIQRIVIICIFACIGHNQFTIQRLVKVLPFSACMCASTILSSYCLTIMPLAAFLSFKKFIILFIMIISCTLSLPVKTNHFQNLCIFGIIAGGIMVGQRDILAGDSVGYISCMLFNLSQALLLQYSAYLCRNDGYSPSQLQFYHAIISLPYFIGTIYIEDEIEDISIYFKLHDHSSQFYFVFAFAIFLAVTSELTSNWIAMRISPFEKSTVSNIKDLILMLLSIYYFKDFLITWISGAGIFVCLLASALFSVPYMQKQVNDNDPQKNTFLSMSSDLENQQINENEEIDKDIFSPTS